MSTKSIKLSSKEKRKKIEELLSDPKNDINMRKIGINLKRFLSFNEMLIKYEFLSRYRLMLLLYNKKKNGFSGLVFKIGKSFSFDTYLFEKWLKSKYKDNIESESYKKFKKMYDLNDPIVDEIFEERDV